jgi:hypothetical protein
LQEKAHFLYLATPVALFYLKKLQYVVKAAESWTRAVRMTKQLKRDLEWWKVVPEKT